MISSRGLAALARFAIAGVQGDAGAMRRAVVAARAADVPRVALEETGLMLVLYAGYPAALEAMRALCEAWPGQARRSSEGGLEDWRGRGEALCARVYGPVYPRLTARVSELHPDLAAWMVDTGYGRVLSRPGLDPRERELLTVAVLAHSRRPRQLVSHLLGAWRLGANGDELRRLTRLGARGPAALAAARRAWREAFAESLTSRGGPS
jgi:4-carboxymuconolactone decarboxylase